MKRHGHIFESNRTAIGEIWHMIQHTRTSNFDMLVDLECLMCQHRLGDGTLPICVPNVVLIDQNVAEISPNFSTQSHLAAYKYHAFTLCIS